MKKTFVEIDSKAETTTDHRCLFTSNISSQKVKVQEDICIRGQRKKLLRLTITRQLLIVLKKYPEVTGADKPVTSTRVVEVFVTSGQFPLFG